MNTDADPFESNHLARFLTMISQRLALRAMRRVYQIVTIVARTDVVATPSCSLVVPQ